MPTIAADIPGQLDGRTDVSTFYDLASLVTSKGAAWFRADPLNPLTRGYKDAPLLAGLTAAGGGGHLTIYDVLRGNGSGIPALTQQTTTNSGAAQTPIARGQAGTFPTLDGSQVASFLMPDEWDARTTVSNWLTPADGVEFHLYLAVEIAKVATRLMAASNQGNMRLDYIFDAGGNYFRFGAGTTHFANVTPSVQPIGKTALVHAWRDTSNVHHLEVWVDGMGVEADRRPSWESATAAGAATNDSLRTLFVGASTDVTGNIGPEAMRWSEIILFPAALSASEQLTVEDYLFGRNMGL